MENKKKSIQKFANKSVNARLKSWVVSGKKTKKSLKSAMIKKLIGSINNWILVVSCDGVSFFAIVGNGYSYSFDAILSSTMTTPVVIKIKTRLTACHWFVSPAQHPDKGTVIRISFPKWGRRLLNKKHTSRYVFFVGAPTGIRTPVVALKGLRPSPLDDGGRLFWYVTA